MGLVPGGSKTRIAFDLGTELRDVLFAEWQKQQAIGVGGSFAGYVKELLGLGLATSPQLVAISGARKRAFLESKYVTTVGLLQYFKEQVNAQEVKLTEIRAAGTCTNCGHSWLEEQAQQEQENEFPAETPAEEPPPEEPTGNENY